MSPVIQEAVAIGGAFGGFSSLLTVIVLVFRTKSDVKMGAMQFQQNAERQRLDGVRLEHADELTTDAQNFTQLKINYDIVVGQRDFALSESKRYKTESESQRAFWDAFDLTFEDVCDLAKSEMKRRKENRP